MTRPYMIGDAFPDHHDPVEMVRHHHGSVDVRMGHVFRDGAPTPLDNVTQRIRHSWAQMVTKYAPAWA